MLSLNAIVSLIVSYRYLLILPISIIEGPIVTVIAAFLASQGYFNILFIYFIVVLGDIVGDIIYYYIGRFWKQESINKLLNLFRIKNEKIEKAKQYFNKNVGKTLLFGKFTHSAGFVILIGAGMARIPLKDFIIYNLIGIIPKSLLFILIGYFAGSAYNKIDSYIGKISLILFIFIIVFIVWKYFYKQITKKIEQI